VFAGMLGDGFEEKIDSAIAVVLVRIVYDLAEVIGDQRQVFSRRPDIDTADLKMLILASYPDRVVARPPKNGRQVSRLVPRTMQHHQHDGVEWGPEKLQDALNIGEPVGT
jgi:hypothetical protein